MSDGAQEKIKQLDHEYALKAKHSHYEFKLTRHREWQVASFKAIIEFAHSSIRSLLLLNGGALIAILSLLANLMSKGSATVPTGQLIAGLRYSVFGYVLGLACAAAAAMVAYLSQSFFTAAADDAVDEAVRAKADMWAQRLRVAGVVTCIVGLAAFCAASIYSAIVITSGLAGQTL